MIRGLAWAAAGALAVVVLLLLALPYVIGPFIFRPEPLDARHPERWGLAGASVIEMRARDGSTLSGWWLPPPRPSAPTILLVHGRSANMATRAAVAARLHADGFGILLFDYRGYGASTGHASEAALTEDTVSAYDWLRGRGVPAKQIMILGQSLGNAPASSLARMRPAAALILVSPFTNLPEAAADRLPWLPSRLLPWPRNRFEVAGNLLRPMPLVLVASRGDGLVPISHSRKLLAAAHGRVLWIEMPSAPHDGLLAAATANGALTAALRRLTAGGH